MVYLERFRDLKESGAYAWVVAAFSHLYDNLDKSSLHDSMIIVGYMRLLHVYYFFIVLFHYDRG